MRARLDSLTGLRFVAALLVFFHHTLTPSIVSRGLARVPQARHLAEAGMAGVTFFFVLSGFVLTWSWSDDLPRRAFYGRRFGRVYPLHATFFVLAVLVVLPLTHGGLPGVGASLLNLGLVHSWVPDPHVFFSANGPSWSLACEAAFYGSLPFLLPAVRRLGPRARLGLLGGAFAVLALAPVLVQVLTSGRYALLSLWVFPPYRACEFVFGVVLGLALREGWRPRWSVAQALVAAGVGLVVGSRVMAHWAGADIRVRAFGNLYTDLVLVVPMTMLIAAVALRDVEERPSRLRGPVWRGLGDASFAFYLCHAPIILLAHRFTPASVRALGGGVPLTLVVLAVCVAVAWLFHIAVERPCEARIRARLPRARSAVPESVPG